jgi:hypothetical protein
MGIQKKYKTDIKITKQEIGPERRQEILDGITEKDGFLPKGVLEADMDRTFIEFLNSNDGLSITIGGEKVPVIFLTIQRWSEFTKTWKFTEEKYKDIKIPFITVIRKTDIQQGQNQAGLWNIPGNRTYTFMKVPTFDGIRRGIDLYKIPQPTSVDLTYEVRVFAERMKDLNTFNRKIQKAFQSRQCYINPNGHPMPLHLESIGSESNIDDFENRRFYVQLYEIKLLGYLLDEEDFEVMPTINRTITTLEVDERKIYNDVIFEPLKNGNVVNYTFVWKPKSDTQFSFVAQYNASFTQLVNVEGLSRIVISKNGGVVFDGTVLNTPLTINGNDVINIKVYKNFLSLGKFVLIGSTF